MKPHCKNLLRPTLALILAGLACSPPALSAVAPEEHVFVYPNGSAEWTSAGDFNGDGWLDVIIVDRETGAYRIGYQNPGGAPTWTSPRASGIGGVSGFSVGHLFNATAHGLAFAAEEANRVNVVAADNAAQAGVPVSVFLPSVGPNQVVAIDIGGAGNVPQLHDLLVQSAWNGVAPYRSTTIRNANGTTYATILDTALSQRDARGNRIMIKDGTTPVVAMMGRGAKDTLRVISYAGGPANTFLQIPNLDPGSEYTIGRFSNNGLRQFLVFTPGRSNLWVYPVNEPFAGTFVIGAASGYDFGEAISAMVTLPGSTSARLLVIFIPGTHAAVYNFDGVNPPTVAGEFDAPDGEQFLGATPLEGNAFDMHTGGTGKTLSATLLGHEQGTRTGRSLKYTYDSASGTYVLAHNTLLPQVTDLSGQANVFQFQSEPFVAPSANLLDAGNAGDWSSIFNLSGGPAQVSVQSETFIDSEHGLDNPTATSLGTSHPLTQFGLVNQYLDSVSIYSLAPGAGRQVVEVTAVPAGGLYARSIAVSFVTGTPGFDVLYRLNPHGAWQTYSGKAISIYTNSVLQFRAREAAGTLQSSIKTETYTFKQGPGGLDSDSDGVPDPVEIANNLDPVRSGSDADGDGYSDLEELLKGTSPNDNSDYPSTKGFEQHAQVDFHLTPRPLNGVSGTETVSRGGPVVRVFDGAAGLLGVAPVRQTDNAAIVTNVFIDPKRKILVAATEQHFDVQALLADRRIGRELVRIIPGPELTPIKVNYQFGSAGGVLKTEAQNWVRAATNAYGSAARETRAYSMTMEDTTVAALLEEKLRRALLELSPTNGNLTLFPFRQRDAGRLHLDQGNVRELLEQTDGVRPAYDFKQLFHSLESMVIAAPNSQVQSLNAIVREIYRVSSVFNNDAPGQFPLPLDTLREFIRTGSIHSNYLAAGNFLVPVIGEATAGVEFVMSHLGSRPVTNLTLRIRPDTFGGGCTVVETTDPTPTPLTLSALGGGPFDFPDTFTLLPGSVIHVLGHPDVISSSCDGLNVEVLAIGLAAVPASSDGDADGNLLPDSWEKMFLGMMGVDPFGDTDGDGYSELQEMMEGTDPRDGLGVPASPAAKLALPTLELDTVPDGSLRLEWFWPEAYRHLVQFEILATADLNLPPMPQPIVPVHLGQGRFSASLPNPGSGSQFFTIRIQLSP